MAIPDKEVIRARLAGRIEPDPVTGCHVFTGCWDAQGTGRITIGSRTYTLRRVVAWLDGRIELWEICYPYRTCTTPACANPKHIAVAPNFGTALIAMRKLKLFTLAGRFKLTPLRMAAVRLRLRYGDPLRQIAETWACAPIALPTRWREAMDIVEMLIEVERDVRASREYRDLVLRVALAKFGPKLTELADEATKDTVVETGLASNYTSNGLAWHFRNDLSRRPNSREDLSDVEAQMVALIEAGISGQRIFDLMKKRTRGERTEAIWEFCKRVRTATPVKAGPDYHELAAETQRRIRAAEGR